MPQFARDSDYYYCALITGPSHVLLGLAFDSVLHSEILVEKRPQIGGCDHGELSVEEIRTAIEEGVARAREVDGRPIYPCALAFVENDSRRYGMFGHAAYLIAKRVNSGEPFDVSGPASYRAL